MNFQFYLEKLFNSKDFQEFKKINEDAYPCSCFFSVDLRGNDNKQHFDYFVPIERKLFSFKLESQGEKVPVDFFSDEDPKKILLNYDFDFEDIKKMISKKMEQEKIKNEIQKMLFSLQNVEGKNLLIGTIFISMMGLLQVHIDIEKMQITSFEKKSFFDIIKVTRKDN